MLRSILTIFRTTFDNVIVDPSSLYNLLTKHIAGPAEEAIVPYVYSGNEVNHYEEAMTILQNHYGSQNGVINAHKKILMGGKVITDTIADFEGLSNDLKSFSSVLKHYNVTSKYFSEKVVKDILERRMSKFTSREFTNYMNSKVYIINPVEYLSRLNVWINEKNVFLEYRFGQQCISP